MALTMKVKAGPRLHAVDVGEGQEDTEISAAGDDGQGDS
jgi:hypothetical protein